MGDSERQLHSSGSLSDVSKNGMGLPCDELSTLSPKPDEELLLQEGKTRVGFVTRQVPSVQTILLSEVPFTVRFTGGLVL